MNTKFAQCYFFCQRSVEDKVEVRYILQSWKGGDRRFCFSFVNGLWSNKI